MKIKIVKFSQLNSNLSLHPGNYIRVCKNCWHWSEPDYSERQGKCELKIFNQPYTNTDACKEFKDRGKENE